MTAPARWRRSGSATASAARTWRAPVAATWRSHRRATSGWAKLVCGALLHDVVEDTDVTPEDIEKRFGREVAGLVEGVTKLSGLHFDRRESVQAENFRKMLLSMSRDLRVIFIKLADRVHNMRTIQFLRPEKVQRIAAETREIYAPLAHRLGIASIKRELEDLSLKALDPGAYQDLTRR